jgi:hypothetical protein
MGNPLARAVLGAVIGGILGIAIPVVLALAYIAFGGDAHAAGAFSFFPILLVPLGLFLGAVTGFGWSKDRSVSQNLLAGLWWVIRPRWL